MNCGPLCRFIKSAIFPAVITCLTLGAPALAQQSPAPAPASSTKLVNEHLLFASQSAAAAWVRAKAPVLTAGLGFKTFSVLEHDPRLAELQAHVHRLWGAYAELFPKETEGLNEPPVVLVESEAVNAFVPSSEDEKTIPHMVIVLSGLLGKGGGEFSSDGIEGLLAHELAHTVFKHNLSRKQSAFTRFYQLSKNPKRLPFQAPRDPGVEENIAQWLQGAMYTGPFTSDHLLNLPSLGSRVVILSRILLQIEKEFVVGEKSPACVGAEAAMTKWKSFFVESVNDADSTLDESHPENLRAASAMLIRTLTQCVDRKHETFDQLFSHAFAQPQGFFGPVPVFDDAKNMVTGLLELTKQYRSQMKALERSTRIVDVGFFSYEQHADEMSVMVLAYLQLKSTGIAEMFENMQSANLGLVPAGYRARCEQMLNSGKQPPLGLLIDAHHGLCYRIYNVQRLAKILPRDHEALRVFIQKYHAFDVE